MSLFSKKNKPTGGTDSKGSEERRQTHGIEAQGDALRDATLYGLLIALLPFVIGAVYLILLREPAARTDLSERVGQSYATQQAQVVAVGIQGIRDRTAAAAASPLMREALAEYAATGSQGSGDDKLQRAKNNLSSIFPEAASVRLVLLSELGTADPRSLEDLRNHIEIDLVRRASNGTIVEPESYQLDGTWFTSIAQLATLGDSQTRRGVILVTLDDRALNRLLRYPGDSPGRFSLEQVVRNDAGSRSLTLASVGEGVGDLSSGFSAQVWGTPWRVVFNPSPATARNIASRIRPDYDVLGAILLCMLIGFFVSLRRGHAAVAAESEVIIQAVDHRSTVGVRIPGLVRVGRELRRLAAARRTRSKATGGEATSAPAPTTVDTISIGHIEGRAESGLNPTMFRAYDIRGVADTDLDDETVYRIGSAIGSLAGESGEQTLILARDARESSSRIKAVLEKALLQSGRDVIDIGIVPTPLLYFATTQLDARSGVMITGSHNPPQYNGMKVVLAGRTIAEGTIERLRKIAESGQFSKGMGRMIQRDVMADYFDQVVGDIAIAVPLKVVVDAGNGATGHIAPELLEELGCEVVPLHCELDGSFPNRSPDTSNEDNLADLVREVVAHGADFGVAYDGDGDRLAVVSSSGRILRTDVLMMLFARDVVSRNPGADVVYDVKCSRNLARLITSLGGRPVLWKTGHALMKQKMLETGALLGGEFSGHVFFGERWFGFDDAMYATGRLAEILSSQHSTLDDLVADLPTDLSTPEILVPVKDEEKFQVMERFARQATFPTGKINNLDGIRVDFEEGWGLLRASNTTAALTARFEARDEVSLEVIRSQFRSQLAAVAPELNITF